MAQKPKSDRTSVTISKRVHRELHLEAVRQGVTQRSLLERIIIDWLRQFASLEYNPDEEED